MAWGAKQNEALNALIKSTEINPDLDRFRTKKEASKYLFEKSLEHFPDFTNEGSIGKATAVRRLRLKCLAYCTGKDHDGARKNPGYRQAGRPFVAVCVTVLGLRYILANIPHFSCSNFPKESSDSTSDDEDDEDDEDTDEEENEDASSTGEESDFSSSRSDKKMPPKKDKASSTKKKSKSKSPKRDTAQEAPSDLLADLQLQPAPPSLPSYVPYKNKYEFPFFIKTTNFINGSRKAIVDFHCVSVHSTRFVIDVVHGGEYLSVAVELPANFVGSDRIAQEYAVQGDRDQLVGAHREVANRITQAYQGHHMISRPPQLVKLPFQCEQALFTEVVWNVGDGLVFQDLSGMRHPSAHQMMPCLRATLTSVDKDKTMNVAAASRVVPDAMNPPGGGGAGAGYGFPLGGAGLGGGIGGGGGGGVGGGGGGGGVGGVGAACGGGAGGRAAAGAAGAGAGEGGAAAGAPVPDEVGSDGDGEGGAAGIHVDGGLLFQQAIMAQRAAARAQAAAQAVAGGH